MKRLTDRNNRDGIVIREMFDRLADYEDIGLEPDEIRERLEAGGELLFEQADIYEPAQAEKEERLAASRAFVVNGDMFGAYVKIPTGASRDMHVYKVIGLIESNGYCDVPIMGGKENVWHEEVVPVLKVVHCGVCEEEVVRVALSDCKIVQQPNDPLTLDELREMDGEPVWVVWVPQLRKKFPPFWGIVSTEYEDVECTLYCVMFEDYGGEWIAYRRKLEDE